MRSLEEVQLMMARSGIPGRDAFQLPTSPKRFPDGGWYRMEIAGIERPEVVEAVADESAKRGMPIHRLISTVSGSTLLDDAQLKRFARLAADARMEVLITPGPRAGWDIGRQIVTPEGSLSGGRFRGSDQLSYAIADILRCIDLGFRGFLIMDEGLMWLVNELREKGDIPKDVVFKVSIFAGHANAAGGKVLESLGADTFNPVADLSIPQLAGIRQVVNIPMDIFITIGDSWGGMNRFYDCPEIARVAAPCYFKIETVGPAHAATPGAVYRAWTSTSYLAERGRDMVKFAEIIHQLVQTTWPEARMSEPGVADLAIPRP